MPNQIENTLEEPRDPFTTSSPTDPTGPHAGGPVEFQSIDLPQPKLGLPLLWSFARDVLGTLSRIARTGDAVRVSILWQRIHYLSHPALVRAALLEDEKSLVKETRQLKIFRLVQGRNVLSTVGQGWKRQRKLLAAAFTPRQVANYLDLMRTAALDALEASFPPGQRVWMVDPAQHASLVTMDVMLRVLFSEPILKEMASGITHSVTSLETQGQRMLLWPIIPEDWMPFPGRGELRGHRERIRQLVRGHIEQRRLMPSSASAGSGDLLDTMLQAEDIEAAGDGSSGSQRFSTHEIEDNCMALFLAGYDTSATALTWWMAYMANHPEHAVRARREITEVLGSDWHQQSLDPVQFKHLPFLEATLMETMRLRPPFVAVSNRRALVSLSLAGIDIQKGDIVSVSIWDLHHDPRWFPEPAAFKPERFLPGAPEIPRGAFMPFGAGPHLCIGQHFAMLEMKLIAALMLSRFEWSFPPGEVLPDPHLNFVLKPSKPFRLQVTQWPTTL